MRRVATSSGLMSLPSIFGIIEERSGNLPMIQSLFDCPSAERTSQSLELSVAGMVDLSTTLATQPTKQTW